MNITVHCYFQWPQFLKKVYSNNKRQVKHRSKDRATSLVKCSYHQFHSDKRTCCFVSSFYLLAGYKILRRSSNLVRNAAMPEVFESTISNESLLCCVTEQLKVP